MPVFPIDMKNARVLITNDDSIHSEGIKVLEEIMLAITPHVWVCAPETQMSAAGHSLTIHTPLRIKEYDTRHYSVNGTPTDSALVGVQKVMKEFRPDLVISGINHGENTADDVTYSGTIAAAIETTLMGIPSIACSQDYDEHGGKPDWAFARKFLPGILDKLAGMTVEKNVMININFPRVKTGIAPEIRTVKQGHFTINDQGLVHCMDPRGRPYFWIGPPPRGDEHDLKKDMGALKAGHITITPLSLNLTHYDTLTQLEGIFQ